MIDRELAERSLHEFVKQAWHIPHPFSPFVDNWHIGAICEHLEALTRLQIRKLIINIPPRHSKSMLVSVFWPAWVWLRDPSSQWIFASYDTELVQRDAVRARDIARNRWYKDGFGIPWTLKLDMDKKSMYRNTMQGMRISTTPEGKSTGFDADYAVADDPHNVREMYYPARLKKTTDWWGTSMTTRGNEPARLRKCIIQQRIHEKDITGAQLAAELGYEHLCLPMEYEPKRCYPSWEAAREAKARDPIVPTKVQQASETACDPRTVEGEVIWPERFTPEVLEEWKKELGAVGTAGQLQQRPAPAEGGMFKAETFRKFLAAFRDEKLCAVLSSHGMPDRVFKIEDCRFFQTVDSAMTAKTKSDWFACGTWALTPEADLLLWDVFRAKLEIPHQYPGMKALYPGAVRWDAPARRFVLIAPWPRPLLFQAIEDRSSGIGLIQQGAADGHPFKVLQADGDKVERASTLSTMYYAGKVWHRDGSGWLTDYEQELLTFPMGAHDDQVDMAAYAAILAKHDQILRAYLHTVVAYRSEESEALDAWYGPPGEEPPDAPSDYILTASGEAIEVPPD